MSLTQGLQSTNGDDNEIDYKNASTSFSNTDAVASKNPHFLVVTESSLQYYREPRFSENHIRGTEPGVNHGDLVPAEQVKDTWIMVEEKYWLPICQNDETLLVEVSEANMTYRVINGRGIAYRLKPSMLHTDKIKEGVDGDDVLTAVKIAGNWIQLANGYWLPLVINGQELLVRKPPNTWDCPQCTFKNPGYNSVCEMCKTPKPVIPRAELERQWLESAFESDVNQLQTLLDQDDTLISCHTGDGSTALHIACRNGSTKLVKFLLQHDADFHTRSLNSQSPVDIAVEMEHQEILDALRQAEKAEKVKKVVGVLKRGTGAAKNALTRAWKAGPSEENPAPSDIPSSVQDTSSPSTPSSTISRMRKVLKSTSAAAPGSTTATSNGSLPTDQTNTTPPDTKVPQISTSLPDTSRPNEPTSLQPFDCTGCKDMAKTVEFLKSRVKQRNSKVEHQRESIAKHKAQIQIQKDLVDEREITIEKLKRNFQRKENAWGDKCKKLGETFEKQTTEKTVQINKKDEELRYMDQEMLRLQNELAEVQAKHEKEMRIQREQFKIKQQQHKRELESLELDVEEDHLKVLSERNSLKRKNESISRDLQTTLKKLKRYDMMKTELDRTRQQLQQLQIQQEDKDQEKNDKASWSSLDQFYADSAHENANSETSSVHSSEFIHHHHNSHSSHSSKHIQQTPDDQTGAKLNALGHLANQLSDTILEKEQIIESLKSANSFLGKRVLELEKRWKNVVR